jgi:hypothetical protein
MLQLIGNSLSNSINTEYSHKHNVSRILKIKFTTSLSQTNGYGEILINTTNAQFKNFDLLQLPAVPRLEIKRHQLNTERSSA